MLKRIVSGGQTGADRAAWDVALELGLELGGWVPRGRLAEDGTIPARYSGIREAEAADPSVRTVLNVRDSDATLVISNGALSGGSLLAYREAVLCGKPVLHLDLSVLSSADAVAQARQWLQAVRPISLNVAGPRASQDPFISEGAAALLRAVLSPLA
jgi:hypothetical protein